MCTENLSKWSECRQNARAQNKRSVEFRVFPATNLSSTDVAQTVGTGLAARVTRIAHHHCADQPAGVRRLYPTPGPHRQARAEPRLPHHGSRTAIQRL